MSIDRLRGLTLSLLPAASTAILLFYLAELLLNRVIFRIIVFIPPGPAQEAFGSAVAVLGLAFLNASALASALAVAALLLVEERRVLRALYALTLALIPLNLAGLAGMYWAAIALGAAVTTVNPLRAPEAMYFYLSLLAEAVPSSYTSALANIAWLVLPLVYLALVRRGSVERRWLVRSLPAALIAAGFAARDPYIASQVLVFAMGLLNPWMLAVAIPLYAATGSRALLGVLLTGPEMQLSFQPVVLVALYGIELRGGGGGS